MSVPFNPVRFSARTLTFNLSNEEYNLYRQSIPNALTGFMTDLNLNRSYIESQTFDNPNSIYTLSPSLKPGKKDDYKIEIFNSSSDTSPFFFARQYEGKDGGLVGQVVVGNGTGFSPGYIAGKGRMVTFNDDDILPTLKGYLLRSGLPIDKIVIRNFDGQSVDAAKKAIGWTA